MTALDLIPITCFGKPDLLAYLPFFGEKDLE